MITATNLTKKYSDQILFQNSSFVINPKERIGLIGRNGSGKTTLFKIMLDEVEADEGSLRFPKHFHVGYVKQHLSFTESSVLLEGCEALADDVKDQTWKVEKILSGLGFSEEAIQQDPNALSGGYQVRLNLAKALVAEPDMLLLDEPTNYLDIVAIRWLEKFLLSWKQGLMLITHDRMFMDRVITHTLAIHRKRIRKMEGTTGKFYNYIMQEEEIYEKTRLNEEKERKQTERFIQRFRAKARLAGMVQSRVKALEKKEKIEALEKDQILDFSFNSAHFPGAHMMSAHNVSYSYEAEAPFLINKFSIDIGKQDRIAIVGKNGKGKSTLMKLLAEECKPKEGKIKKHAELEIGYFSQTNTATLSPHRTVVEEIMSADPTCIPLKARNIAGTLMFSGDHALKKISVLSGGEKSRVLLGKLLVTPAHLLLLDEPTHHLDMESCEALLDSVESFDGSVVMVTHNEEYLHQFAKALIIFDRGKITFFEGTYQDFLDRVGWSDEENKSPKKTKKSRRGIDKKEIKRMKAELMKEKTKKINPLKSEISRIETVIAQQEKELAGINELLVESSSNGDGSSISEYSKQHHAIKMNIDSLFKQLEKITQEYERAISQYKEKMEELKQNA